MCVCVCVCVCIYMCVYIYICVCIYIYIYVMRVYALRFFVSSQQKFGVRDIEAPSAGHSSRRTDRVIALK